jgi:hypothetical protein
METCINDNIFLLHFAKNILKLYIWKAKCKKKNNNKKQFILSLPKIFYLPLPQNQNMYKFFKFITWYEKFQCLITFSYLKIYNV